MERGPERIEDEGENQNRPAGIMSGGTESASENPGTLPNDLESASAENEDWGIDTMPHGDSA